MVVKLDDVLDISVTVPLKSAVTALCHLVILPVLPLSVNTVELVPEQTDADPAIVPPTLTGLTVIVAVPLFAASHEPLFTTAI